MYSGLLHSYNNRRGTIADAEEVGSKSYMDGRLLLLLPDSSPGAKGVSPLTSGMVPVITQSWHYPGFTCNLCHHGDSLQLVQVRP